MPNVGQLQLKGFQWFEKGADEVKTRGCMIIYKFYTFCFSFPLK